MSEPNRKQKRRQKKSEGKETGRQVSFPRVKIAIPFYRNVGQSASILMMQIARYGIPGYDTHVDPRPGCFIHLTRTDMVSGGDFDYCFFIDDDIGFDPAKMHQPYEVNVGTMKFQVPIMIAWIKQILDRKLDICGGVYVNRGIPHAPQVYQKDEDGRYVSMLNLPDQGLGEVDGIATGFMCIKSTVIEKMMEDFGYKVARTERFKKFEKENPDIMRDLPLNVKEYLEVSRPTLYPPFWLDNVWDSQKKRFSPLGEDLYFCREATRLGFKIHVDYEIRLGHESSKYVTMDFFDDNYKATAQAERKAFLDTRSQVKAEAETLSKGSDVKKAAVAAQQKKPVILAPNGQIANA